MQRGFRNIRRGFRDIRRGSATWAEAKRQSCCYSSRVIEHSAP